MVAVSRNSPLEEQLRRMLPVTAPESQRAEIAALLRLVDGALESQPSQDTYKLVSPNGDETEIPETVFYLLERLLEVMVRGDSVTIVPVGKELTTQQAANLLNISRQYLVRLLEAGDIPHTKTGRHRRLNVEDVLRFKRERDCRRRKKLDDLSAMSQDFGGYEELK